MFTLIIQFSGSTLPDLQFVLLQANILQRCIHDRIEEEGNRLFADGAQFLHLIGCQRQNTIKRLNKGDIRHILAADVKEFTKGAMILFNTSFVCIEDVTHEIDRLMYKQGIEIPAWIAIPIGHGSNAS